MQQAYDRTFAFQFKPLKTVYWIRVLSWKQGYGLIDRGLWASNSPHKCV